MDACAAHDGQLTAKRKRPDAGLGHRRHSPARLHVMEMKERDFSGALYVVHGEMERQFARLTKHGGGLMPLGNWLRRPDRVQLWVQAKRIIHGLYVLSVSFGAALFSRGSRGSLRGCPENPFSPIRVFAGQSQSILEKPLFLWGFSNWIGNLGWLPTPGFGNFGTAS